MHALYSQVYRVHLQVCLRLFKNLNRKHRVDPPHPTMVGVGTLSFTVLRQTIIFGPRHALNPLPLKLQTPKKAPMLILFWAKGDHFVWMNFLRLLEHMKITKSHEWKMKRLSKSGKVMLLLPSSKNMYLFLCYRKVR